MMRVICLLLVSLFALKVNAQQYTKFNGYGFQADRIKSDSISIHPSDTIRNKAARSIAVLNGVFYIADGTKWKVVGTDTTALSNRINLKLNIADTINKWVTNVYKVDDTTIAVLKNGTTTNIVLSPQITSVNATRLVTSVYNNTGSTIAKGSVVYISGRHSSNLPTIALAEADNEANSYKTFALVQNDIATSSSGIVIQAGNISNLNLPTSSFTDGDIVYLSPSVPGGITITKPLAPNHICKIGSVTRAHPTLGSIEVKIENGWQLDELSDVQIAAVPVDSTILQFSRVDSLWHDINPTTAMGNRFVKRTDSTAMLTPYLRKADTITLSNRINLKLNISDTATMLNPYSRGSGTSGQVGYWNATRSLTGSSNLFWDNANGRLGIGTNSPANALDVNGTARVQSTLISGSGTPLSLTGESFAFQNVVSTGAGGSVFGTNANSPSFIDIMSGTNFWHISNRSNPSNRLGIYNASFTGSTATYSSELFTIFTTGNVGIGTTTDAGYKFDINGTARVNNNLTVGTTSISSTALNFNSSSRADINFKSNGSSDNTFTIYANGGAIGSNYAQFGTNDGSVLGSQGGAIYTDSRTGVAPPLRFMVKGTGTTTMTNAMAIYNTANVGIGTSADIASSKLTVESTTQGFLPPRMTTAQRDLIATPAAGLIIYNTSTNKHQGYNGTTWNDFY